MSTPKTYKRETAAGALIGTSVVAGAAIGLESEMALKVLEIIVSPVILLAGSMFGLDGVAKQTSFGRPTPTNLYPDEGNG